MMPEKVVRRFPTHGVIHRSLQIVHADALRLHYFALLRLLRITGRTRGEYRANSDPPSELKENSCVCIQGQP